MTLMDKFKQMLFGSGGKVNSTHIIEKSSWNTTSNVTRSINNRDLPNNELTVESEAGAIAGLIFGLIIVIIMVTLALVMIRKKRVNDRQYQKRLRIQRSTKTNAGVYMDTTMTEDLVTSPRTTKGSAAYVSLQGQRDLYENDSEDEI